MERAEKIGLGVAVAGHAVLFGLLSLGFLSAPPPETPPAVPVDISLVDKVALDTAAPPAPEPPARSQAPEVAPPAEAPPPAPAQAPPEPDPAPPAKPPEPVPAPRPVPKAPPKPERKPAAKPDKPPEKARPVPAKATAAPPAKPSVAKPSTGTRPAAPTRKPGGFQLAETTLKGLSATPSPSKAPTAPPAATMSAQAAADIGSAIKRQVQPCADRQVNPGPGASRIVVTIRLQLNRDGTLIGRPTVSDNHGGVDDENSRYVDAVDRNAIATFMGCAPLRGLPPELYDVPRGWKSFSLRYKLPG